MEKLIEIYDNILSPKLVDYIENFIAYPPQDFRYNFLSNVVDNSLPYVQPGLTHPLSSHGTPPSKYNTFFNQILYDFCFTQNIILKDIYMTRTFLQFPSPHGVPREEKIHTDLNFPHWVCLYYVNDSDGDTILYKDDEKTEIKRISPKKGRIVFFDGSIKHCGSFPSKNYRSIINFDFLGEKF